MRKLNVLTFTAYMTNTNPSQATQRKMYSVRRKLFNTRIYKTVNATVEIKGISDIKTNKTYQ